MKDRDSENKVVGGMDAEAHAIPWQVSNHDKKQEMALYGQLFFASGYRQVAFSESWYSAPFCGGTLIGPSTVLSAAHCFDDPENPDRYKVMIGQHQTDRPGSDNER